MKANINKQKIKKSKEDYEEGRGESRVRFAVSAQSVQKALQHWKWRLLNMRLRDSITRLSALALIAAGSWGAVHAAETPQSVKEDGYFLSLDQKTELIQQGEITGANGTRYDVRIVPGYEPTMEAAREHIVGAGERLDDYATSEHYTDIADTYREGTEFIANDVAKEFIYEGIRDEWKTSMSRATESTRKQVIGWPLAFPWSVTKSTVETAGRATIGAASIVGGAAYHYALSPTVQMLSPAVLGTVEGVGGGVAVPIVETAWNTAVAPPLALAGRMPSEERADGYFVRVLPDEEAAPVHANEAEEELSQLSEELSTPTREIETANTSREAGCCVIFDEIMKQHMAYAVIEARASNPQ